MVGGVVDGVDGGRADGGCAKSAGGRTNTQLSYVRNGIARTPSNLRLELRTVLVRNTSFPRL